MDAAGQRRRRRQARRRVRAPRATATGSPSRAIPRSTSSRRCEGEELVGLRYEGPFDHLPAQEGVEHRVIPWDEVSLDEGTGIVHIAPGCGARGLRALARVRPAGADADRRVGPDASRLRRPGGTDDRGGAVPGDRVAARAWPAGARPGSIEHRYPVCWRCSTPLVFRVVDDWFISARGDPAADAGRRTRRSNGRLRSTRSGWTTGCATWATGTSRAVATSGFRCRSIRASAATST